MIGAILLGLIAGTVGRMLVPDMWSGLSGPKSWLFSLLLGLAGAMLGYLIFTAVSYTHLDVYKRQSARCRTRSPTSS